MARVHVITEPASEYVRFSLLHGDLDRAGLPRDQDLVRLLAKANPDEYLPALATILSNLGNHLAQTGQQQAALSLGQEAIDTYRQLAEADPGAYLPLATALNNLGDRLAETGQGNERPGFVAVGDPLPDLDGSAAGPAPDREHPHIERTHRDLFL
jgi:tetratricopeptide (TPR) repeat protein